MKSLITITALLLISIFADNCSDLPKKDVDTPVYVEYFKNWQVLEPTYGMPDTLIVLDAVGLNNAMSLIEQGIEPDDFGGDASYDSLFKVYCIVK